MDLSKKIRKYRQFRDMTQKELGILCGFPANSADSRIREFESGKKIPKQEILQKIADALNVSILDFLDIKLDHPADILHVLFNLEDQYGVIPQETDNYSTFLAVNEQPFQEIIHLWAVFREMYASEAVSLDEYENMKLVLFDSVKSTFESRPRFSSNKTENNGNT